MRLPARKQIFRIERDGAAERVVIARHDEPASGRPLLRQVMSDGRRVPGCRVSLEDARRQAGGRSRVCQRRSGPSVEQIHFIRSKSAHASNWTPRPLRGCTSSCRTRPRDAHERPGDEEQRSFVSQGRTNGQRSERRRTNVGATAVGYWSVTSDGVSPSEDFSLTFLGGVASALKTCATRMPSRGTCARGAGRPAKPCWPKAFSPALLTESLLRLFVCP